MLFSLIDITNTSDQISENLIMRYPDIDKAYANEAKLDFPQLYGQHLEDRLQHLWLGFPDLSAIFN